MMQPRPTYPALPHPRHSFADGLLMFLLLCVSGNPCLTSQGELTRYVPLGMLLVIILGYGRRIPATAFRRVAKWGLFLMAIFLAQGLVFGSAIFLASANYIVKLSVAIFGAYVLGDRFPQVYLKTISAVAVISICCYALNCLGVVFPALCEIDTKGESIFLYTQLQSSIQDAYRNAGMFWEPGAFAGYLMLVPVLFANDWRLLVTRYRGYTVLLLVALLTTTSTTGYLLLFVWLMLFFAMQLRRKWLLVPILCLVLPLSYYVFMQLEFLNDKLTSEYEQALEQDEQEINFSRMGSLVFDMHYIKKHPLIGNGLVMSTRFADHLGYYDEEELDAFSNGFTGNIASLGVFFMIAYLASLWRNRTLRRKGSVLLLVVLLLQGEYFLNYPIFLALPFVNFSLKPTTYEDHRRPAYRA